MRNTGTYWNVRQIHGKVGHVTFILGSIRLKTNTFALAVKCVLTPFRQHGGFLKVGVPPVIIHFGPSLWIHLDGGTPPVWKPHDN